VPGSDWAAVARQPDFGYVANVPDMYSVDVRPDPLILDVWQSQRRYVKFIAQDVWSFVPRLVRGEKLVP
jgi:hypothetical protein